MRARAGGGRAPVQSETGTSRRLRSELSRPGQAKAEAHRSIVRRRAASAIRSRARVTWYGKASSPEYSKLDLGWMGQQVLPWRLRSSRIHQWALTVAAPIEQVVDPLTEVAVCVVQTPGVRQLLCNGMRAVVRVLAIPANRIQRRFCHALAQHGAHGLPSGECAGRS